jgi:hypothetical protein
VMGAGRIPAEARCRAAGPARRRTRLLSLRVQWQREGLCRGDCAGSQSCATGCGRRRSRRLGLPFRSHNFGLAHNVWYRAFLLRDRQRAALPAQPEDSCYFRSLLAGGGFRSRRSLCALIRLMSSSSASISSLCRASLDFGSVLRSFCNAFSTESLVVSAMLTSRLVGTRKVLHHPNCGLQPIDLSQQQK